MVPTNDRSSCFGLYQEIQNPKFLFTPSKIIPPPVPRFTDKESARMQVAIDKLLRMGAIRRCVPYTGQFLSPYFLVPKPNGESRFMLNLKKLNASIATDHFKMEDWRTAQKLMTTGCFMATLDLQDAYFLVPLHEESCKFMRFVWNSCLFEFTCLPFGLCITPWIFTKIIKPVAGNLRSRGHQSIVYLNDGFCLGDSFDSY